MAPNHPWLSTMWFTQRIGTNKRGQKGKGTVHLLTQCEQWRSRSMVSFSCICLCPHRFWVPHSNATYIYIYIYISLSLKSASPFLLSLSLSFSLSPPFSVSHLFHDLVSFVLSLFVNVFFSPSIVFLNSANWAWLTKCCSIFFFFGGGGVDT